jgi:HEAT repeat protein
MKPAMQSLPRMVCLLVCCCLLPQTARAQQIIDNEALIKMVEAGVDFQVVKKMIASPEARVHFVSDHNFIIQLQVAAQKGQMPASDLAALQTLVVDKSQEQNKFIKEAVMQLMNMAVNAAEEGDAEYERVMRNVLRFGKAAVATLLEDRFMNNDDEKQRAAVLDALARIGSQANEVLRNVRLMLNDTHPGVRRRAAETLAKLAPEDGRLTDELLSDLPRAKHGDGILFALGFLKDPRANPDLLRMLKTSRDEHARTAAAWALGNTGQLDKEAIESLLNAVLDDQSPMVRGASGRALAVNRVKQTPDYIQRSFQRHSQGRAEMLRHLEYFRSFRNAQCLVSLVEHDQPQVRMSAGSALRVLSGENFQNASEWEIWLQSIQGRPDWIDLDRLDEDALEGGASGSATPR